LRIEHAFLAHDGDEEQWIDAELGGLRLDGAAVRPWEDDAEHARVVRRLERRLPAEANGGRTEAAGGESVAPGEEGVDVLLRRAPEDGAHLCLRRGVEPGEE